MDSCIYLQSLWIAIHFLGLVAAWGVRACSGSRFEAIVQAFFLFQLAVISLAALAGHIFCWPLWTLSAGTLGIMVVTVLVEFSKADSQTESS
ncbi:MAG: hypothetical protein RH917_00580 [Lacipirellulaceae bacterium]